MAHVRVQNAATIDDLARIARRRVPRMALGHLESGTGEEFALKRNREALDSVALTPRCMRDLSGRSAALTLFGQNYDLPIRVSPVGLASLYRCASKNLGFPRLPAFFLPAHKVPVGGPFPLSPAGETRRMACMSAFFILSPETRRSALGPIKAGRCPFGNLACESHLERHGMSAVFSVGGADRPPVVHVVG
jgi:hypothetical protein